MVGVAGAEGLLTSPARFVEDLTWDDQVVANELVAELKHSLTGPLKMVGPLFKMSEPGRSVTKASPTLSEHSQEILRQLGYSDEQVGDLKDSTITV